MGPAKPEFRSTGLKTVSTLRLHKLATIHSSSLARYLGKIDSAASATVQSKLKQLLALEAGKWRRSRARTYAPSLAARAEPCVEYLKSVPATLYSWHATMSAASASKKATL